MTAIFPLFPHPFALQSCDQTRAYARALAPLLQPGDMISFSGDLGAGKSTFIREMIQFLHQTAFPDQDLPEVPSPTFTLVQSYQFPNWTLSHYDLYRLEDSSELLEIGVEEMFPTQISCIEWPDRLGEYLAPNSLGFYLSSQNNIRQMQLFCLTEQACQTWQNRLADTLFTRGSPD